MDANIYPSIWVLVAARNEEANIAACLDALIRQAYPKDKFEIWVGDDGSEDGTAAIIASFEKSHLNIRSLLIKQTWKHCAAKPTF
jgi:glycosyltransferase involved in cell wall biosynthesis